MNYEAHYNLLVERARDRFPPAGYIEHHHVTPRCMGGTDDPDNLVALTPEEHYLAHLLLVKMYPDHEGLLYAATLMTRHKNGMRRSNKYYGWLKRKFSKVRKKASKGSGNTQYGTVWINKIGSTENRKIDKGTPIPKGWQLGRKLKETPKNHCLTCGAEISKRAKHCLEHSKAHKQNAFVQTLDKKKESFDVAAKKALLESDCDIDLAMKSMGYKVPQYGYTRNKFVRIKQEIERPAPPPVF